MVSNKSSPPLSSSRRSRHQSWDVSRSHRGSSLSLPSLSYGDMMDITVGKVCTWESLGQSSMVDITEGIVGTWQLSRCSYRSLGSTSRGQTLLVDLVVGGQQGVVTVGVGGAEGLQVVGQLGGHSGGQDQQDYRRLEIKIIIWDQLSTFGET